MKESELTGQKYDLAKIRKQLKFLPHTFVDKIRQNLKGNKVPDLETPTNTGETDTDEFTKWKDHLTADQLDPNRGYDPTLRWFSDEEIDEILTLPNADVQGISETQTQSLFNHYKAAENDQVAPFDRVNHVRGSYILDLQFVSIPTFSDRPLDGGRYEIALANTALPIPDGHTLVFGGIPARRPEEQTNARETGKRLLNGLLVILENSLATKTDTLSHKELFSAMKSYLEQHDVGFVIDTSYNPPEYR